MRGRISATEVKLWRILAAASVGAAAVSGVEAVIVYSDLLPAAKEIVHNAEANGDDFFRGASQKTVDGLIALGQGEAGTAAATGVMAVALCAIGGRMPKETEADNPS